MKRKDIPSDYETELKNCFDKWDHLNEYGGSDPSFADGVNMDLERNHIIYFKAKIEETLPPYPEIYYRDTPPKVDIHYIARPDEIRKNAAASLELFEQSDSFQFLQTAVKNISDKQAEDLHIHNILGYERTLRIAISKDDLIIPIPDYKVYKKSSKNLRICVFAQIFCLHFNEGSVLLCGGMKIPKGI